MPAFFLKRIGWYKSRMQSDIFIESMHRSLVNFANKNVIPMYERTTSTWEHKPEFSIITDSGGLSKANMMQVIVYTDDRIYGFIDDGTSIRWALMSGDWKSKTTPWQLNAEQGSGYVVMRGIKAMTASGIGPKPGIEARHFTEMIMNDLQPRWKLDMQYAVREAGQLMKRSAGYTTNA